MTFHHFGMWPRVSSQHRKGVFQYDEKKLISIREKNREVIPALLNQLLAITPSAARPNRKSCTNSFILRISVGKFDIRKCLSSQCRNLIKSKVRGRNWKTQETEGSRTAVVDMRRQREPWRGSLYGTSVCLWRRRMAIQILPTTAFYPPWSRLSRSPSENAALKTWCHDHPQPQSQRHS